MKFEGLVYCNRNKTAPSKKISNDVRVSNLVRALEFTRFLA